MHLKKKKDIYSHICIRFKHTFLYQLPISTFAFYSGINIPRRSAFYHESSRITTNRLQISYDICILYRKLREDYQNALPLQRARENANISLFSSYVLLCVRACMYVCVRVWWVEIIFWIRDSNYV